MFVILAKKLGSQLALEDVPPIPQRGQLSGADIEGMVGRAWRASLLAGADHVTQEALAEVVAQFMPSTQGLERELQETAAILECTDRQFLPPAIVEKIDGRRRARASCRRGSRRSSRSSRNCRGVSDGRRICMARTSWFDDKAEHPLIQEQVAKLESFTSALADGVVTKQELGGQEQRLVAAMKTLERELSDEQHAKVTTCSSS